MVLGFGHWRAVLVRAASWSPACGSMACSSRGSGDAGGRVLGVYKGAPRRRWEGSPLDDSL